MATFVPEASRRIVSELNNALGRHVEVVLVDGKRYTGLLLGFDHPEMNVLLGEVEVEGEKLPRLLISGKVIAEIRIKETMLFDPEEFANYLTRRLGLRPDAVRVYKDAGVVTVYNNVRVTATGVEGSGTLAAKVSYILKEYLDAKKRGEKPS
ncbi:MAG: Lsm family RNA-binding protein [Thermoproteota archaeon]